MKKEKKKEEEEIIPVPQETEIEPGKETVVENKPEERPRQTFGQVMKNVLVAILRLILLVGIIGSCGAAIYFGVPLIYNQYIRPVEENTSQLNELNFRQNQSDIQIADLQTQLATLEAGQTAQGNSLTDLDTRFQTLGADQTSQNDSITALDSRIQTLEAADSQRNESLAELTYQSDLIRAMELLSRARLFLYQSNFGLARSDVQAARNALAEMQSTAPESKQKDLTEALFRLDLAITNLPDFPVAASDDLDIAWQILMDGYPVPATSTPTPLPPPTSVETPTPPPFIETTSTPNATP